MLVRSPVSTGWSSWGCVALFTLLQGGGGGVEPGGSDDGMTITITISSASSGTDEMCQEMIALCGLSSWDTPTPVFLCSGLADWLSSIVVYAQGYRMIDLGSNPWQHLLWRFFGPSVLL